MKCPAGSLEASKQRIPQFQELLFNSIIGDGRLKVQVYLGKLRISRELSRFYNNSVYFLMGKGLSD